MKRAYLLLLAFACAFLAERGSAQLTVNYDFTVNTTVPDNGQLSNTQTLGGLSDYTSSTVRLNLTSQNANDPMWLGDMYSTLTVGTAQESSRTAVLLNRPGVDNNDAFGSGLSSLNVTLDDTASHTNIFNTTTGTGTYNSDGRLGVDPYGSGRAFSEADRDHTLTALNGAALASNKFTILMADTAQGGTGTLSSWGVSLTGTAASSGTMAAGSQGTMSISDGGSGTNNLGATVSTTQLGGGALQVTIGGTTTFSGGVTGTGGLTKLGSGTLALSAAGTYSGPTTVGAGTLLVSNTTGSATGTGAITVSNTGTLSGSGFINAGSNNVTIDGTLSPGSGVGAIHITAGALTLNSNATTLFTLGTTSDLIALGAGTNLNLAGTLSLTLSTGFNYANTYTIADNINNLSGTFGSVNGYDSTDYMAQFNFTNGAYNLSFTSVAPVPEPSTWAAGILAVLAVSYTQRRRFLRRKGQR